MQIGWCVGVLSLCVVFIAVTSGLQWTSPSTVRDNVTIPACVGQDVSIPWNYTLDPDEHEMNVEWYFTPDNGTDKIFLGTLVYDHFLPDSTVHQHIQYIDGVGLRLVKLGSADSGTYWVHVNVNLHGSVKEHTQRVHVVVTAESITDDGHLVAQFEGARFLNSSQEHQLILVCGTVAPTWVSKVDIVWTTPRNQTMPSTFQENGQYSLAVPNPFISGKYTCHIADVSPATVCIPSGSPLNSGASVLLDGVEGRFALMDSQMKAMADKEFTMAHQIQGLQTEKTQMAGQIHTLEAEKTHMAGQIHNMSGQIQNLQTENTQMSGQIQSLQTSKNQMGNEIQDLQQHLTYVDAIIYKTYSIRLVGGRSDIFHHSGRVEVNIGGVWGTVCDDDWDDHDARVVCNQLGYHELTARAQSSAHYGAGSGPIYMDDVKCTGNETHLLACPFRGLGVNNCGHSEDAGVDCYNWWG